MLPITATCAAYRVEAARFFPPQVSAGEEAFLSAVVRFIWIRSRARQALISPSFAGKVSVVQGSRKCFSHILHFVVFDTFMSSVASCVRQVLDESDVALSALVGGFLNLSAYAKKIRPEVARRTRRDVSVGTIVVALCRYEIDARKRAPLTPKVRVESIAARSGLTEVTFAKNPANRSRLRALLERGEFSDAEVLTVTSGMKEISLIIPAGLKAAVLKVFKGEVPALVVENLAGLTVRFPAKYLTTPNTIFALLRPLAVARINIVEVVSTYTELTVVVAQKDLQAAFAVLSRLPTI